jgi:hypothetical protein
LFYFYLHRLAENNGVEALVRTLAKLCDCERHGVEVQAMFELEPRNLTLLPPEFKSQFLEALARYERAQFRVLS